MIYMFVSMFQGKPPVSPQKLINSVVNTTLDGWVDLPPLASRAFPCLPL